MFDGVWERFGVDVGTKIKDKSKNDDSKEVSMLGPEALTIDTQSIYFWI